MTEKVKITQKQFDWLERYKYDEEIDYAIDIQPYNKRPDSPVADWKPSEVARALYNGYEVEPEPLKVGDWAKHTTRDGREFIGKIHEIKNDNRAWGHWNESKIYGFIYLGELVKMTPEEIEHRKWAEIEAGDILKGKYTGTYARFIEQFPTDKTVDVLIRSGTFETWDMDACELYAKKVGASK